jgi:hypothetical protein
MTDEEKKFELKEEARLDEMYDARYASEDDEDEGESDALAKLNQAAEDNGEPL